MKTILLLGLSTLMVSGVAVAQEEGQDHRSAWAKSQDMYVEPTLRITETVIPVTPEQAAQQNLSTRQVDVGTATGQSRTTVVGPDGQAVQQTSGAATSGATTLPAPVAESVRDAVEAQGTPVQDLSRPVQ